VSAPDTLSAEAEQEAAEEAAYKAYVHRHFPALRTNEPTYEQRLADMLSEPGPASVSPAPQQQGAGDADDLPRSQDRRSRRRCAVQRVHGDVLPGHNPPARRSQMAQSKKQKQGLVAALNPGLASKGKPLPAPNTRWPAQLPFGSQPPKSPKTSKRR
jgi:hypothetical protein